MSFNFFKLFLCLIAWNAVEGSQGIPASSPAEKKLSIDTKVKGPLKNDLKLFKDLHIMMGLGANYSLFRNEAEEQSAKLGPSFKADVIYTYSPDWSFEFSGTASYIKFEDIYVWDTLLTMGIRKMIGRSKFLDAAWFSRFYIGFGRSVVFVNDRILQELNYSGDINRIHFGGEATGLGLGLVWQTEDKQIHFIEINYGIHFLKNQENVNIQNEVPVVVANERINDNSRVYHTYLTYGVLLF